MKRYSELYTSPFDGIIFTILSRTFKDLGKRHDGNKKMVERCISSRKSHPGETFFHNISFWPTDAIGGEPVSFFIFSLFEARIINAGLLEKKRIGISDGFLERYLNSVNNIYSTEIEARKDFIKKYGLEINKASEHIYKTYNKKIATLPCPDTGFDKINFYI